MSDLVKVIIFAVGIMALAAIGEQVVPAFNIVKIIAFVVVLILLGYWLFKKLFGV